MVTLKAYIDSATKAGRGRVMCVAATLFRPPRYRCFKREWEACLREWPAPAFHATDFYPGGGEFKRKRDDGTVDRRRTELFEYQSRRIPYMIGEHSYQHFVVMFNETEFNHVAPAAWVKHYGGLYSIAVQTLLTAVGHWADEMRFMGRIQYFLEAGDKGQSAAEFAMNVVQGDASKRAHSRISTYRFARKGTVRGLEAADFVAWHWNKFYVDSLAAKEPRDPRRDLGAFLSIGEDNIHTFIFTGAELVSFLCEHGCRRRT